MLGVLSSKDELMRSGSVRDDRLWQARNHNADPAIPEWIHELWTRYGARRTNVGRQYPDEGQALLWFVSEWIPTRAPYRLPLPEHLVTWLNGTELDLKRKVKQCPGLQGPLPCDEAKPVSRLMATVAEQHRRSFDGEQNYHDFLRWFVFSFLPENNIPGVLLPASVVNLLNRPAGNGEFPFTVGMLLYLEHAYPEELNVDWENHSERTLALSFCAVEGILSIGQPRLIPAAVSRVWRRRPLKLLTAFEYVSAHVNNGPLEVPSTSIEAEEEVRDWFQREVSATVRGASLMSGPPGNGTHAIEPSESMIDFAIVVYRDHETVCGLSSAGASAYQALIDTGIQVYDLHFSLVRQDLRKEMENNRAVWTNCRSSLHLLNLNPEYAPECCYCNLSRIGKDDYIIGQFAWELPRVSPAHRPGIALVDEIWTGSQFLAELYQRETGKPAIAMGQVIVAHEPAVPLRRNEFGFAEDDYLFLCNFDAQSVVERKNPLGTIIAFQTAFPYGRERTGLIIKTRNLEHFCTDRDRQHWAEALERLQKDPRIRVIDHTMSADALAALYRMCDCFVSLHRSEGFGFGPAEAMVHGRPVIATNYSGVCDFCTEATAKLVPYELIQVKSNEYPYLDSGQIYEWADPDLTVAAECMRELAEDRRQARRLGQAAREFVSRKYSVSALRARYLERLEELGFIESMRPSGVYGVKC